MKMRKGHLITMRQRAVMKLYVVQTIIEGGNFDHLKGQVSRGGLPEDLKR